MVGMFTHLDISTILFLTLNKTRMGRLTVQYVLRAGLSFM
jgi:hypothetical protein